MPLGVEYDGQAAQGLSVNAFGLGQLAHGASIVAGLARVDHRHAKPRRSQGQLLLVATRGLQQHETRRQWHQHLTKLGVAGLVIAQTQSLQLSSDSNFEAGLGDIDTRL